MGVIVLRDVVGDLLPQKCDIEYDPHGYSTC